MRLEFINKLTEITITEVPLFTLNVASKP